MPKVSIIIVSYNTKRLTVNCIKSIYEKTKAIKFEVCVIDNASKDNSVDAIRKSFPGIKLIVNSKNLGFGQANNIGIRNTSGEYVFFLNSDTLLKNNSIKKLCDFMNTHKAKNIAGCGGQLYNADGSRQASFGNFPSLVQILFETTGLHKLFNKYYQNNLAVSVKRQLQSSTKVDYICGADLLIRRDVLERLGGFDKDFFMYYEETELCYRINNQGYHFYIVPSARITHFGGQSLKKLPVEKATLMNRNLINFIRKAYGPGTAIIAKTLYLFWHTIRAILFWRLEYLQDLKTIWHS